MKKKITTDVPATTVPPEISHEEVAQCARQLWEEYGRPENRDEEIWLEAEAKLQAAAVQAREHKNAEVALRV